MLAFSRFTYLRGKIDVIYSDNATTFCAASSPLSDLLGSTEFHNALGKSDIDWIKIPPYAPSQGLPSLIELQTFASDAVRIVNNRPLTTYSDQPNDLSPITPSSFLGQGLAPNTPMGSSHDIGDLRKNFIYNATFSHKFWLSWMKSYLPTYRTETNGRFYKKN